MAQYQVPQFLEVEDRIIGQLTLKQFLYSAGGAGVIFISWTLLPKILFFIIGVPLGLFFFALAFYKVNDLPFAHLVENMFKYSTSSKLYVWNKEQKKIEKKKEADKINPQIYVPKLSESKLRNMSWELDIHEKISESAHNKIASEDKGIPLQF